MKKILALSSIVVLGSLISSCASTDVQSLESSGFLYPHSQSKYIMGAPAKAYSPNQTKMASTTKPTSINPNAINNTKTASTNNKQTPVHLKREIAIINAPYQRVFQELIKFCSLNNYHILKQSYKEGLIKCDITTNTAQFYENQTPKEVSKFVLNAPSLGGLAAWTLTMDMFITPGNNKTMIEFVPKYYAVSMNSKGKLVLTSNGYFENSAISFINQDLKNFP
ncbi:hypothetical protein HY04AAS1_0317 [Hydrogenobaculum sp. Y04AAS1]|uniref:hypothetical protein n=1 Tax=Hydrogenobaculum sp. (strain Y04AAS1) TaxID=380749 RepID=UPI00015BD060|nr:hypothetical protein HY04AAS1_0317 [Hydrogenobaculum sp. Y04AAS1]HCT66593.1 hypothetical protein [Hydrogenobaculum sp.]